MEVYKRNVGWQNIFNKICVIWQQKYTGTIQLSVIITELCFTSLSKVCLIAYSSILTKLWETNKRCGKGVVKFRIFILFMCFLCVFGTSVASMLKSAVVKLHDCDCYYTEHSWLFLFTYFCIIKKKGWNYVCCSSSQAKNTHIVNHSSGGVGKRGEPTLVERLDNGKCPIF